jgi:hypothetical protein
VCGCVCVCVCVCVYIYVYVYIYICIYSNVCIGVAVDVSASLPIGKSALVFHTSTEEIPTVANNPIKSEMFCYS